MLAVKDEAVKLWRERERSNPARSSWPADQIRFSSKCWTLWCRSSATAYQPVIWHQPCRPIWGAAAGEGAAAVEAQGSLCDLCVKQQIWQSEELHWRRRMLNWRQIRAYTAPSNMQYIDLSPLIHNQSILIQRCQVTRQFRTIDEPRRCADEEAVRALEGWQSWLRWQTAPYSPFISHCLIWLVGFCTGWSQQEQGRVSENQEGFIILPWCTFQCDPSVLCRWFPVLLQRLHRWKQLGKSCRGSPAQVPHLQ